MSLSQNIFTFMFMRVRACVWIKKTPPSIYFLKHISLSLSLPLSLSPPLSPIISMSFAFFSPFHAKNFNFDIFRIITIHSFAHRKIPQLYQQLRQKQSVRFVHLFNLWKVSRSRGNIFFSYSKTMQDLHDFRGKTQFAIKFFWKFQISSYRQLKARAETTTYKQTHTYTHRARARKHSHTHIHTSTCKSDYFCNL